MSPGHHSPPFEASLDSSRHDHHYTHSSDDFTFPSRSTGDSSPAMPDFPPARLRDNSSPSTPHTTEHGVRPRKRVDWNLAATSVAEAGRLANAPEQSLAKHRPSELDIATTSAATTAEQEEELRRDIHRMFSNQPPNPDAQALEPQMPEPQPPPPSVPRINVSDGKLPAPPRPKKPVLRSGAATPQLAATPPVELESGIENLAGKARSADVARAKADRLSKTLDDDEPQPHQRFLSRWMHAGKSKRDRSTERMPLPLYHDGGESIASGQSTPDEADDLDYVPRPSRYRAAGLSAQMLLSGISPGGSRRNSQDESGTATPVSPSASPPMTPGSYSQRASPRQSVSQFSRFLPIPGTGSRPSSSDGSSAKATHRRPILGRFNSADHIEASDGGAGLRGHSRHGSSASLFDNVSKYANIKSVQKSPSQRARAKKQVDISIKKHVEETRMRQRYLLKLCKALMEYGAPSHRLEDYMKMSARVLETEAQFLYMPSCMIVSFDDSATHTTEVKLIRSTQGVDLGKLKDVHDIYKDVVHDNIGVHDATEALAEVLARQKKFRVWFLVLMHGFASATVGPFAFKARWIDLPIAFFLGLLVGFLRLVWAAKSDLYAAIFEVTSVILTSFLARAFGSIYTSDGQSRLFCFSALAQSAIALILPGYIILCGALELQSHNILAGSVRVFYAVIYALFIGFGLTIGSVIYGAIDKNASSAATCDTSLPYQWNFLFVFLYTITLVIINQAKLKQMPLMILISMVGYVVSYFSGTFFQNESSISSGLAALAVSLCANGYSRVGGWLHPTLHSMYNKYAPWFRKHGLAISIHVDRPKADEEAQDKSKRPWWRSGLRIERLRVLPSSDTEKPSSSGESTPAGRSERQDSVASTITLGGMSEDPDASIGPKDDVPGQPKQKPKKVNYALAAAAMLPAIFVLVPSGLSVSGSLLQGIQTANEINQNANKTMNATSTSTGAASAASTTASTGNLANSNAFAVSFSVIEIAIGLTVGLFLGALVIYPFGKGGRGSKTRSGLFTF